MAAADAADGAALQAAVQECCAKLGHVTFTSPCPLYDAYCVRGKDPLRSDAADGFLECATVSTGGLLLAVAGAVERAALRASGGFESERRLESERPCTSSMECTAFSDWSTSRSSRMPTALKRDSSGPANRGES